MDAGDRDGAMDARHDRDDSDGDDDASDGDADGAPELCSEDGDCVDGCHPDATCAMGTCDPGTAALDGVVCDADEDDATRDVCVSGACARSRCGDRVVDPGASEQCDDGNDVAGDGCEPTCVFSCTVDDDCDDSDPCNGVEVCGTDHECVDGAAAVDGTSCDVDADPSTRDLCLSAICVFSTCGDEFVDSEGGEICDDGNDVTGDGCEPTCTFACSSDPDCDDSDPCSGMETCASSTCAAGTAQDDGTTCTLMGVSRAVCRAAQCVESTCGDGFLDAGGGEACDDGNDVDGDGCDDDCTFSCLADLDCDDGAACTTDSCDLATHRCANAIVGAGTECRASAGSCDLAEACDGVSAACPADVVASVMVCRAATGPCDAAESCDGTSPSCPADLLAPASTTCRAAVDLCDVAETCSGTSPACPSDAFAVAMTTCRASAGECDVSELCNGTSSACPIDGYAGIGTSCTGGSCNGGGMCTAGCTPGASCSTGNPCERGTVSCTTGSPVCVAAGPAMVGTVCRPTAGACDVAETCNGTSTTCPSDGFAPATTSCRMSAGGCDIAETCTGSSATCPSDTLRPASFTCRNATAGGCDVAENCTGSSAACPADTFVSSGTSCRPTAGGCDVAETCSGTSANCPSDAVATSGTTCRPTAGGCDVAETCNGTSASCPSDAFRTAAFTCRAMNGACDVAETCTGSSATCPNDAFVSSGTSCRTSAGACDVVETCSGTSGACPSDGFAIAGTSCRMSAGACDVAETCSGSSASCPSDSVATAGTSCRPVAGGCDLAETCNGSSTSCPADAVRPASFTCRSATDVCDLAENCTGSSAACPADALRPSGASCRMVAGACDVAETCTGSSAACPSDAFASAGTTCRTSAGACDVVETCSGSSASCPADGYASSGTVCRPSTGACDLSEVCAGGTASCPGDTMRSPSAASLVSTSSDDGTPLTVCVAAGSGARFVAYTDLRDASGIAITGATVTIGGVAATESATQAGVYYREVTAAASAGSRTLSVVATACATTVTLTSTISVTDAAANATTGGTGGCNPTDGNIRVRVVAAETGSAISGASVMIGTAQGTPFQQAANGLFGGSTTMATNVATTDASGYATFYDYGAVLAGPIMITAGAAGRALFTIVDGNASDVVLPLPLTPTTAPTTTQYGNTGTYGGSLPTGCSDMDASIVIPNMTLEDISAFDTAAWFQKSECYASGNGNVGTVPVPQNLWIPTQSIGPFCLGGSIATHAWHADVPNTASTGLNENLAGLMLSANTTSVQNLINSGGTLADVLLIATHRKLGFILNEVVPTAPTGTRSIAHNEDYPTAAQYTFSWTGATLPTETDVVGVISADYENDNGIGRVFPLGIKVRAYTSTSTSFAVSNSDLNDSGSPTPVQRFGALEALYLDPTDHPTIAANRVRGVTTVLVRGADGSPVIGATSGTSTVTNFLGIAATTFTSPGTFTWTDPTANGNSPMYSMHELTVRTSTYYPVLSCDTSGENEIFFDYDTQWIVMKPYQLNCGSSECFTLPTLPASFPRATTGTQQRSGFTQYVGSGASCTGSGQGTCALASESCVDPDGATGPLGTLCMTGSGTAASPYKTQDYRWRLHSYDLNLAPSFSFNSFTFSNRRLYMTHESSNNDAFQ